MSESEHIACNAVMEQKDAKGKQCWRPPTENGYCGIHQKHALLKKASDEGRIKCRTHRCIEILDYSESVYCKHCINKKEQLKSTIQTCNATIDQGPTKGSPCSRKANESGFCGKHISRQLRIKEAVQQNKRICDDGKRACKQFTTGQKLLCDNCLKKSRDYDNTQYQIRKELQTVCVTCGEHLESTILGENEETIQKCQPCYVKMKDVEKKRIREERNYNIERKNNTEKHYNEYKKCAVQRNVWFELTKDEFKLIVNQQCFYCESYNRNEVIGIDRLYSDLGYCLQNCVPCCKICNIMKNDMTPTEFINHLQKFTKQPLKLIQTIQTKLLDIHTIHVLKQCHESYIRSNVLVTILKTNRLESYIEICKKEKRSDNYIQSIQNLSQYQTQTKPFIRNEIRKIFQ